MNVTNDLCITRVRSSRAEAIPLVLLHGWGFSSQIWSTLLPELSPYFDITLVDLPGHGKSPILESGSFDDVLDQLVKQTPANAIWLGWSLGGVLSLAIAKKYPTHIRQLLLVASTPKFVADNQWSYGVRENILEQFTQRLEANVESTLTRFIALQTFGVPTGKEDARALSVFVKENLPSKEGLRWGLSVLKTQDLRNSFNSISCPVNILLGGKDALVPVGLADYLLENENHIKTEVMPHATHMPFFSNPDLFTEWLFNTCHIHP